jgi:hypothetical protein
MARYSTINPGEKVPVWLLNLFGEIRFSLMADFLTQNKMPNTYVCSRHKCGWRQGDQMSL